MKNIIREIPLALNVVSIGIVLFIAGSYFGMLACSTQYNILYPVFRGGWMSDMNPYYSFFDHHKMVAVFAFFAILASRVKGKLAALIEAGFSVMAIITLWGVLSSTSRYLDDPDPYLSLAKQIYNYDIFVLSITLTSLALRMILIVQTFRPRTA